MTDTAHQPASRRTGAVAVDVVLLAILLLLLAQSFSLSGPARRFPLLVIGTTLLLILLDLIVELTPRIRRRLAFLQQGLVEAPQEYVAQAEAGQEDERSAPGTARRPLNEWIVIACVCVLGVTMYFFGYVITAPLFVAVFSIWRRVPAKVWVSTSAALFVFNYVLLYELFNLR